MVRLQDEVHYIYRHDGAMVILKQIPMTEYQADSTVPSETSGGGWRNMIGRINPRSAVAEV